MNQHDENASAGVFPGRVARAHPSAGPSHLSRLAWSQRCRHPRKDIQVRFSCRGPSRPRWTPMDLAAIKTRALGGAGVRHPASFSRRDPDTGHQPCPHSSAAM